MLRHSKTPVQFDRTRRSDEAIVRTSGRAGKVIAVSYAPLLRGDSCAGSFDIRFKLGEMPRPLENGVMAKVQAWFVPDSSHPRFASYEEFMAAYNEQPIQTISGQRNPPEWRHMYDPADPGAKDLTRAMGIHNQGPMASTLLDAYNLIWNFRASAYSDRILKRPYLEEQGVSGEAMSLAPAFWPSRRYGNVVPDYERALVVGDLDLDVTAGQLPIDGLFVEDGLSPGSHTVYKNDGSGATETITGVESVGDGAGRGIAMRTKSGPAADVFAEMAGQTVGTSLADIDKARQTEAFAKLRAAYAGHDTTGFDNDDAIIADLMRGIRVPESQFRRPWLLDTATVPFGFVERHATDAVNLDQSISVGSAQARLSINVPEQDAGGVILFTVEVLPERLHERQHDDWLAAASPSDLPDALRDVQRTEPVDEVLNKRLDARHSSPGAIYGFEPMNMKWERHFTRLGGDFYQEDPANPFMEQRAAIWQPSVVDPVFSEDHYLAPDPFPHDVFMDTTASAFECVARHSLTISGLTQFGDVLLEDSGEYADTQDSGE